MARNFITFEIPGSQLIQPRRRELPRKERGIPDRGSGMSEPRNEVAGLAPRLMNRSQNENDQGTRARNSGSLESVRTPWPTRRDRLSRLCRAFLFQRKKEMLGLLRSQARSVVSICARSRVEKRERVIVLPTVKFRLRPYEGLSRRGDTFDLSNAFERQNSFFRSFLLRIYITDLKI